MVYGVDDMNNRGSEVEHNFVVGESVFVILIEEKGVGKKLVC